LGGALFYSMGALRVGEEKKKKKVLKNVIKRKDRNTRQQNIQQL